MRIFVAQLNPIVGDLVGNTDKILRAIQRAREKRASIVLFSELVLCGYPPEDLLLFPQFIDEVDQALQKIVAATKGLCVVLGCVRRNPEGKEKGLFNSAAILIDGQIAGFKDKTLLPTYDVFDERRYFDPGGKQQVWSFQEKRFGVLICEDMWEFSGKVDFARYNRDPVKEIADLHPEFILNLSASPYSFKKKNLRYEVYQAAAKALGCPVVLCNQVGGNDQLVFDGYSFCLNERGELFQVAKGFEEDEFVVDLEQKREPFTVWDDPYKDLYEALVLGVRDYFMKEGFTKACFGLSGGIDSALVACIATEALGKENILALYLPSRFSSPTSLEDSRLLCSRLKIELKTLSIDTLFQQSLDLLDPFFRGTVSGTAEENLQARIRGMVLMAISNKLGHVVLSTGNKSEMAMGYCTLYGDMCGGLGVLIDVSKTEVYRLARWINRSEEIIPLPIIQKPPSAELRANQKDSDDLPDYAIVDSVLKDYVEDHRSLETISIHRKLDPSLVKNLVLRIHQAEYKRRQGPPGIRVTKHSFSKGRFFPIVQKWAH